MVLWNWIRGLSRQQVAGLALVAILLALTPLVETGEGDDLLNSEESQRIGWKPPSAGDDLARDIHERVNQERAAHGLPSLSWDEELTELAQRWSEHMIATGHYEHSPDSYRKHPRFGGGNAENIARGPHTVRELHVGWMESEGHRQNILNPNFDAIGVGIVCRNDGAMWATQIFGSYEPSPTRPAIDAGDMPVVRDDHSLECPGASTSEPSGWP